MWSQIETPNGVTRPDQEEKTIVKDHCYRKEMAHIAARPTASCNRAVVFAIELVIAC